MRVGLNPHKDQPHEEPKYIHQIVIPVFIPMHDGYFSESLQILKLCIESVCGTSHDRTFITIVNNGSDEKVVEYLDSLLAEKKIHELIHTQNIGKLNAILKGISGNNIELVTITDSDVLFLPDWQIETNRVFSAFPKAGVVGIVPQYRTFSSHSHNIILDNLFNKRMKLIPVKNPEALKAFYRSIGWDEGYNPDYLKVSLGYELENGFRVYVGSGHFVATYKKQMFDEIVSYIGFKMGGSSETYLDKIALKKDYWRLTTYDNYACHMGNVYEDWMGKITFSTDKNAVFKSGFPTFPNSSRFHYFIRNELFRKIFKDKRVRRLFLRLRGMSKEMSVDY